MSVPAPSEPDPRTGLQKLRDAFLSPSRGQATVAVLLAVLAFAAVTQVSSHDSDDTYSGLRQADLIQALNGLSAATDRSEADINQLEKTRDSLRNSSQRDATALAQANKELGSLGILAGTLPAVGPGITITVDVPVGNYHANSLLDGIEELRDAGAEAMQINGEVRIIAQTSFQDGDNGIIVDGRELAPPYQLNVIGDPDTLSTALNISGGFKDDVEVDKGTTDVKKSKTIHIDVTRRVTRPRFIQQPSN